MLRSHKILLGVGGGIAAYKSAELVRAFRKAGAEVRVVMTAGAEEFIRPLTLEVLSEHPVGGALFEPGFESQIGHIALARWPDLVVVAPATANLLARARVGMADDLLTTLLLATTAPVLWCPAMNTQMWLHPATRENVAALAARPRNHVLAPDAGELACKEVGPGRLPDPPAILAAASRHLGEAPLAGRRVTVTAGPTREHFDPVRFVSNPSSGKMGYAVAAAAYAAGAEVTLVSGPVALEPPFGCRRVEVVSAAEMQAAVLADPGDVLVMAAAVADWTPTEVEEHKRKKTEGPWVPTLTRTADILAELSTSPRRPPLVVGFAAETRDVVDNALSKLRRKRLDGIVANSVAGVEGAFGNDVNRVALIGRDEQLTWVGPADKAEVAAEIVRWIATLETSVG